jgi:hypothetical protein
MVMSKNSEGKSIVLKELIIQDNNTDLLTGFVCDFIEIERLTRGGSNYYEESYYHKGFRTGNTPRTVLFYGAFAGRPG